MNKKETILLVSNHTEDISRIESILGDEYDINVVSGTMEAREILERSVELISMIIIGSEIVSEARNDFMNTYNRHGWNHHIPVLLITDDIEDEILVNAFDYGIDDAIVTGINPAIIKNRISNYIFSYKQRSRLHIESVKAKEAQNAVKISQKDLRRKNQVVQILGSMYTCVLYVNVNDGRYLTMECLPHVLKVIGPEGIVCEQIIQAAKAFSEESDWDRLVSFADSSTLKDRLKKREMIDMEFEGKISGKVRATIVAADRDIDGNVVHVIYLLQSIGDRETEDNE